MSMCSKGERSFPRGQVWPSRQVPVSSLPIWEAKGLERWDGGILEYWVSEQAQKRNGDSGTLVRQAHHDRADSFALSLSKGSPYHPIRVLTHYSIIPLFRFKMLKGGAK